jgi:hypothetical protein
MDLLFMATPIKKRTHLEMDYPEAPATPSSPTDKKISGVATPVVTKTPTKRSPRTPRNYSLNTDATLPVTPSKPPQTPKSPTSYRTPEPKKNIVTIPPKPSKKPKRTEIDEKDYAKQCYGEEKPDTVEFSNQTVDFLSSHLPKDTNTTEYYRLPSGRHVLAIQQPNRNTPSCGPGCALMIAADHQKVEYAFGDEAFTHWYGQSGITNAKDMQRAFQMLKISCELFKITTKKDYALSEEDAKQYNVKHIKDSEDAIKFMRNTIRRTKRSLITAITHPNLAGHWVIIDEFDNYGNVYGRCPRFGTAFCVSEIKLKEWLFDQKNERETVQSMIIFPS